MGMEVRPLPGRVPALRGHHVQPGPGPGDRAPSQQAAPAQLKVRKEMSSGIHVSRSETLDSSLVR